MGFLNESPLSSWLPGHSPSLRLKAVVNFDKDMADMEVVSASSPYCDLVLSRSPSEWLCLCRTRAMALTQKSVRLRDPPCQQALVDSGMTLQQAEYYLQARANAVERKTNMLRWNMSMPPLLCQSFGLLGHPPQGMRIPLPPSSSTLPSLPAYRPSDAQWPGVSLTWLRENHPHILDTRVTFQEQGHLYFVDGLAMKLSVTGLIDQYSEVRPARSVASFFFDGSFQFKAIVSICSMIPASFRSSMQIASLL